jgi:hypothetical protein
MNAETWRADSGALGSFSRVTCWAIENTPVIEEGDVGEDV